jgi:hypothetical protein
MEIFSAAAIGLVIGWTLPLATHRTIRAAAVSLAIVAVAAVAIGVVQNATDGVATAIGSAAGVTARATWFEYLTAHARVRGEGGQR